MLSSEGYDVGSKVRIERRNVLRTVCSSQFLLLSLIVLTEVLDVPAALWRDQLVSKLNVNDKSERAGRTVLVAYRLLTQCSLSCHTTSRGCRCGRAAW